MSAPAATAPGQAPRPGTPIRTLRGLAAYRCGHAGACCDAGWPIPIEPEPLQVLRRARQRGALPSSGPSSWLDKGLLGQTPDGKCVYHVSGAPMGCTLERALGTAALPTSCRQFPRLLLADDRGWHLSLSSWCVTAASRIVHGTPDFLVFTLMDADARVHVEGLDARGAWPPELRPGVLLGLDTYELLETTAIRWLAAAERGEVRLSRVVHRLLELAGRLRGWTSARGPLAPFALSACREPVADQEWAAAAPADLASALIELVPPDWRPTNWPHGLDEDGTPPAAAGVTTRADAESALSRYLATRAVASWLPYQGRGVRSVVASLVSSYTLAALALSSNGEGRPTVGRLTAALRAADWLQLHLLNRDGWAAWCAQWETSGDGALHGWVEGAARQLDALPWGTGGAAGPPR